MPNRLRQSINVLRLSQSGDLSPAGHASGALNAGFCAWRPAFQKYDDPGKANRPGVNRAYQKLYVRVG